MNTGAIVTVTETIHGLSNMDLQLPWRTWLPKIALFRGVIKIWICLPCRQCFCLPSVHGFRVLYSPSWYFTQYCFLSRNSLHSKVSATAGPCSWISPNSPCFPPSCNNWFDRFCGIVFWRLSYSASSVAVPCRPGIWFSGRFKSSESASRIGAIYPQDSWLQEWKWFHSLLPPVTH